ncbi:hypothetical protein N7522_011848 [Penicillium canescens]|uniref:Uncharacterized protein n=1 Tax=Penicillium canescens TaxID=5083 RepID=A0AAD6IAJ1_PENCN|nr:uncharacterized protein N7446_012092 [Penicillium canescens]KAJ5991641.1 hypothetical protein N7522_011848 [Penicillium canescens]KAJ6038623.1 hypothetical protein N7460_007340 [Penicillium canescens]KAJ6047258.1 hypothetical protein N7446_012092 [Penicillium canescens]KAJ6060018.1 hypothetical protein N7444_002950 [Penicillium canescens]
MAEIEDSGIPVDDIWEDREKLVQKANLIAGEDLILDQNWDTVNGFESDPHVRAALLQNQPPGGVFLLLPNLENGSALLGIPMSYVSDVASHDIPDVFYQRVRKPVRQLHSCTPPDFGINLDVDGRKGAVPWVN